MTRRARASSLAFVAVAASLALLAALLLLPNRLLPAPPGLAFPLELPILLALMALAPAAGLTGGLARAVIVAALLALTMVKALDIGFHAVLDRPFNFAYDLPLLHAVWMLARGTSGAFLAALYLAAALAGIAVLAFCLWRAVRRLQVLPRGRGLALAGGAALLAAVFAPFGAAGLPSSRLLAVHAEAALEAREEIAKLKVEARTEDLAYAPGPDFLSSLEGRDIFVIFVESYGRTTLRNPLYAETTREALRDGEAMLREKGYAMRSAWLTAPSVGGQSWLAHASLLSGLWIDSQGRYRAMLTSERTSLNELAAQSGWRSVAVMPAITMAWPEAAYFGYDTVLAAEELGYRGLPFNWVTMPDQYTLSAFERLALDIPRGKPVFAEIALISSHAPWTPIPEPVDWDAVGDGRIFNAQAKAGDPPEVVWSDDDRVRDQFRQSIDYALRIVASFTARRATKAPVVLVLGDHQPAPMISGTRENRDVPVHIIAEPAMLDAIDAWRWTEGMMPAADAPVWRMDRFRKRFVDAFSGAPHKDPATHEPV